MSWPCYSLINREISRIKCLNSKHLFIGQVTFSILISCKMLLHLCVVTPHHLLKTSAGTVSDCESVFLYSFFRMDSSSSPLRRTIEARRTKRRRKTAAIRWKNWRRRQERCCREVRHARRTRRVWIRSGEQSQSRGLKYFH